MYLYKGIMLLLKTKDVDKDVVLLVIWMIYLSNA